MMGPAHARAPPERPRVARLANFQSFERGRHGRMRWWGEFEGYGSGCPVAVGTERGLAIGWWVDLAARCLPRSFLSKLHRRKA